MDERVTVAVGTPMGEALARLVERVPGAQGAVLSDGEGEAIDYAYRKSLTTDLDIQLCGAQLAQVIHKVGTSATRKSLGFPVILLESKAGALLAAAVGPGLSAVLRLRPRSNLAQAFRVFEQETAALAHALFA